MKALAALFVFFVCAFAHGQALTTPLGQVVSTSYGDSITAGFGTTPKLSYAGLLAADAGAALNDYAISGQTACSMAESQVFRHPTASVWGGSKYVTMMIGTNDSNLDATGAYESIFSMCHLASLTWLGVPQTSKATPQSNACVKVGQWHAYPNQSETALVSTNQGDSLNCSLVTYGSAVYLWHHVADGDKGQFVYAIDGSPGLPITSAAASRIATTNGGGGGVAVVRIAGLPPGRHQISITVTSPAAPNTSVKIYGIGTPPTPTQPQAPRIFAAGVPFQLGNASAEKIAQYNKAAAENIAAVASDGIAITFVDVRHFWLGQPTDMMDLLHPNAQGHLEIKRAFESTILNSVK